MPLAPRASEHVGVSWNKKARKWVASCERRTSDGGRAQVFLGSYASEEDAARAYQDYVEYGVLRPAAKTGNWSWRFQGVTWNKLVSKWQAHVGTGDTRKNLGFFKCEREARM